MGDQTLSGSATSHGPTADGEPTEDITLYRDRPSDDGKKGQKANRGDAPAAKSSLGNFADEDLPGDDPAQDR